MNSKKDTQQGDLHHLEKIFELMEKHEVVEFEWEKGGERLKLKTKQAVPEGSLSALSNPAIAALSSFRISHDSAATSEKNTHHAPSMVAPTPTPNVVPTTAVGASKSATLNSTQKQVVSPFVGTFYRSPSPETDPYVREGQVIKRGDVLCIVEAMKLMNEIEAEFPGKIVSVLVENGQPVEFGEPLFIIEP